MDRSYAPSFAAGESGTRQPIGASATRRCNKPDQRPRTVSASRPSRNCVTQQRLRSRSRCRRRAVLAAHGGDPRPPSRPRPGSGCRSTSVWKRPSARAAADVPARTPPTSARSRCGFDLEYTIDEAELAQERLTDGLFPLVTSATHQLDAREVLEAYKRQPPIERRFEQLKTDYRVARCSSRGRGPHRGFLCVYFFAVGESLIERALAAGDGATGLAALPIPEDRDCRRCNASPVRPLRPHPASKSSPGPGEPIQFTTKLSPLHRQLLRLLSLPVTLYR